MNKKLKNNVPNEWLKKTHRGANNITRGDKEHKNVTTTEAKITLMITMMHVC